MPKIKFNFVFDGKLTTDSNLVVDSLIRVFVFRTQQG